MPEEKYNDSWDRVDVRCPFYRRSDGSRRISCEGAIPGTTTVTYFRRCKDYKAQMEGFCCSGYETCELFRAILESREW